MAPAPSAQLALIVVSAALLTACAGKMPIDQVELMPAPDVFGDGLLNPLPEHDPFDEIPYDGILYATDRAPAADSDRENFYRNDRGQFLRLGVARVELGDKKFDWETARQISMLRSRTEKYPIKVGDAVEWGIMGESVPLWMDLEVETQGNPPPEATGRFAGAINAKLELSKRKDVYIYVHGYKVVFENPVLVSAELWHFLGYEGVFIAYAWPSTPSKFAYIKDSDTSGGFARHLRLLVEFLIDHTDVERIHILGYSNGTRLVTRAMEQLALIHADTPPGEVAKKTKLENVILVGSDLDRGVFGSYVADGLLNVSNHLSIYLSEHDKALGVSQFLTRRERLGQMWGGKRGEMSESVRAVLPALADRLSFINVSPAEGAGTGNGHGYFRSSPWASSDVLMTLTYGLSPEQRGLAEQDDLPIYTFPPDYIERLWDAIEDVDPEFAEGYSEFKAEQAARQAQAGEK